jgi:hypothetical protein
VVVAPLLQAQPVPGFDPVAESTFQVPHPEFLNFTTVSSAFMGKTRSVTMQMDAAVNAPTGSAALWKAYFNDGTILVYCHGAAEIPNIPMSPGQVKLLRGTDLQPLATGSATVSGSTVTLSVTTLQLNPGGLPPGGSAGLDWCETKYLDAATIANYGMSALDRVLGSYFWLGAAPGSWFSHGLFDGGPGNAPSQLARTWKPDPRFRTGPGLVTLPKPGDVDGDGRAEWDSNSDMHVEGNTYIDGWISDADAGGWEGDSLIIVIGHDTNQNGRLEASEVSHVIGKCIYNPGINYAEIVPIEDGSLIHHWNREDGNRNKRRDSGGKARHYIYNTKTGKLKVFDESGNLIFFGDPDDYAW